MGMPVFLFVFFYIIMRPCFVSLVYCRRREGAGRDEGDGVVGMGVISKRWG